MTIASALLRTTIFYGVFSLVVAELIAVNLRVFPHLPWAVIAAVLLLIFWVSTLGRRWSRYRLLAVPGPPIRLAGFILLSVLACLAILTIQGAFFSMRITSLSLSSDASLPVTVAYALIVPPLGAVLEEVSFRGILQGNLEAAVGVRSAAWIAGVIFVAAHAWKPAFVPQLGLYVGVALATGLAAARTRSVAPGMCIHLLVNLCLALLPLLSGPIALRQLPRGIALLVAFGGVAAVVGVRWNLRQLQSTRGSSV